MTAYVYVIENLANGAAYVGSTKNSWGTRWGSHRRMLEAGHHHCKALQKDWTHFGADRFRFQVALRVPSSDILAVAEFAWMETLEETGTRIYNTERHAPKRFTEWESQQIRERYAQRQANAVTA